MVTILLFLLLLCLLLFLFPHSSSSPCFSSSFLNLSLWTASTLLLNRHSFSLASIMIFAYHFYSNCEPHCAIHFLSPIRLIFLRAKSHPVFIFVSSLLSPMHGPGSRAIGSSYHIFVKFRKGPPSGQVQLCRPETWTAFIWRKDHLSLEDHSPLLEAQPGEWSYIALPTLPAPGPLVWPTK